ncbi:lamin tail domain-containing protein [Haliangium ochraceum]|uniref:LTD domain-containing protein n=1 Tax=Haliangium ochraceum (strain DSM 14365 / JCM 11303 / SMP-2) TaxID=502025 RepID=D0LJB9_HALO1|nr:lamin tail domain-containing protein [Haliangium ochraceum]ACY14966.1 conserved hypothetical protein [Haliangium ochraceum DSM 14365]
MAALSAALLAAGCGFEVDELPACPGQLLPGAVVITELMRAPEESGTSWIEVANPGDAPAALRGTVLEVADAEGRVVAQHVVTSLVVPAGAYAVLGREDAGFVDYVYGADLDAWSAARGSEAAAGDGDGDGAEDGAAGQVSLRCDVIAVDTAAHPRSPPGVAVGLGAQLGVDAEANDERDNWCVSAAGADALANGAEAFAGTPGAANGECAGAPGAPDGPGVPETCADGELRRAPLAPAAGDLVITEIMANPAAVADASGEWFEVFAVRGVDLVGLEIGRSVDDTAAVFADDACRPVSAGARLVFAASADSGENGGLAAVSGTFSVSLGNSGGALALAHGGALVDAVSWDSAPSGASLALASGHHSAEANDLGAHWCESPDASPGLLDRGSPGLPNPACAQGEAPGDPELPAASCIEAGSPRAVRVPAAGTVRITEVMADPAAVADSEGEWIELRFDADADLNGLQLGKQPGQPLMTIASEDCLPVAAGDYAVLARSAPAALNGGLPRVDAVFDFGLVNSGGSLFAAAGGATLDSIAHGAAQAGAATSLDEDDGLRWCAAADDSAYGSGDRGTPGAANPACPETAAAP